MAYEWIILPCAEAQLKKLDRQVAKRIVKKLTWFSLQSNPLSHANPLHHPTIGDVRFRIGDYRVIAFIDVSKKKIAVAAIGHRSDIYQ